MAAKALYLKWRPKRFTDVVGQDVIVQTLRNAVRQDKTVHAYLFSGPRGTGKTTTARILAKAIILGHDEAGEAARRFARRRRLRRGPPPRLHRDGRRIEPPHRRHPEPA